MADIVFYEMLGDTYVYPESYKGKAFCRGLAIGPVTESIVRTKAEREKLEWRKLQYEQPNSTARL